MQIVVIVPGCFMDNSSDRLIDDVYVGKICLVNTIKYCPEDDGYLYNYPSRHKMKFC